MTSEAGGIETVTVYCASSNAVDERYMELARETGRAIAERGMRLVYGGGSVGMMGQMADAALASGGEVIGIITRHLEEMEVAHTGLTRLEVVESMHDRKRAMTSAGDGFFVLPGGFGTLDEAIEAITWKQLRIHEKPIVFVDRHGYWDGLIRFFGEAVEQRFIHPMNLGLFEVATELDEAFALLHATTMPPPEPDALWLAPRP